MATVESALDYAKRLVGNVPFDDAALKYRALNDAHNKLWMAAPWRWTILAGQIVTVVNDQQDYVLGGFSGIIYPVYATLVKTQEKYDLEVSGVLPSTSQIKGRPSQMAYIHTGQKLRLLPVPTGYSGTMPKIVWLYKKQSTLIDAGNIGNEYSLFGVPQEWSWVYQEIVLLKAYQFTNSPKLGSVTMNNGSIQYSGQYGVVEAAINEMKQVEKKFFDTIGKEGG